MHFCDVESRIEAARIERECSLRNAEHLMALERLDAAASAGARSWLADRLLAVALRLDGGAGRRVAERLHA